jgi:hypothetical protein
MTAAEIIAHVAQVVAGWHGSDSFLHDGVDENVSWLPSMHKYIANYQVIRINLRGLTTLFTMRSL